MTTVRDHDEISEASSVLDLVVIPPLVGAMEFSAELAKAATRDKRMEKRPELTSTHYGGFTSVSSTPIAHFDAMISPLDLSSNEEETHTLIKSQEEKHLLLTKSLTNIFFTPDHLSKSQTSLNPRPKAQDHRDSYQPSSGFMEAADEHDYTEDWETGIMESKELEVLFESDSSLLISPTNSFMIKSSNLYINDTVDFSDEFSYSKNVESSTHDGLVPKIEMKRPNTPKKLEGKSMKKCDSIQVLVIVKSLNTDDQTEIKYSTTPRNFQAIKRNHTPFDAKWSQFSCIFPSSSLFPWLNKPLHTSVLENDSFNQKELFLVNPKCFGEDMPTEVTVAAARLVADLANVSSEDWAKKYYFNHVFWPTDRGGQPSQFIQSVVNTVRDSLQEGLGVAGAVTFFAYGSGSIDERKSILGTSKSKDNPLDNEIRIISGVNYFVDEGLLSLVARIILSTIPSQSSFTLSILEIQGEELLHDLAKQINQPSTDRLAVREHKDGRGAIVENISEHSIKSIEDVYLVINRINGLLSKRKRFQHLGHIIATLNVYGESTVGAGHISPSCTIQLVDLASSFSPDPAEGGLDAIRIDSRFSTFIQKSNAALGATLRTLRLKHRTESIDRNEALSSVYSSRGISYRETVLTRVLKRTLDRPNSKILMLVSVQPDRLHYGKTAQSLSFAQRIFMPNAHRYKRLIGETETVFASPTRSVVSSVSVSRREAFEPDIKTVVTYLEECTEQKKAAGLLRFLLSDPRQRYAKILSTYFTSTNNAEVRRAEYDSIPNEKTHNSSFNNHSLKMILEREVDHMVNREIELPIQLVKEVSIFERADNLNMMFDSFATGNLELAEKLDRARLEVEISIKFIRMVSNDNLELQRRWSSAVQSRKYISGSIDSTLQNLEERFRNDLLENSNDQPESMEGGIREWIVNVDDLKDQQDSSLEKQTILIQNEELKKELQELWAWTNRSDELNLSLEKKNLYLQEQVELLTCRLYSAVSAEDSLTKSVKSRETSNDERSIIQNLGQDKILFETKFDMSEKRIVEYDSLLKRNSILQTRMENSERNLKDLDHKYKFVLVQRKADALELNELRESNISSKEKIRMNSVDGIAGNYDRLLMENSALQEECERLSNENSTLQKDMDKNRKEMLDMDHRFTNCSKLMREDSAELRNVREILTKTEQEKILLEKKLVTAEKRMSDYDRLLERNSILEAELENKETKLKDLKQIYLCSAEQVKADSIELQDLREINKKAELQISGLKSNLNDLVEKAKNYDRLIQENSSLQEELENKRIEMLDLDNKFNFCADQLKADSVELRVLREHIKIAEKEKYRLENKLNIAERNSTENDRLLSENSMLNEKLKSKCKELENLERNFSFCEAQRKSATEELRDSREILEKAELKKLRLESMLDDVNQRMSNYDQLLLQNSTLEEQLDKKFREVIDLVSRLTFCTEQEAKTRQENSQFIQEITRLRAELTGLKSEAISLSAAKTSLQHEEASDSLIREANNLKGDHTEEICMALNLRDQAINISSRLGLPPILVQSDTTLINDLKVILNEANQILTALCRIYAHPFQDMKPNKLMQEINGVNQVQETETENERASREILNFLCKSASIDETTIPESSVDSTAIPIYISNLQKDLFRLRKEKHDVLEELAVVQQKLVDVIDSAKVLELEKNYFKKKAANKLIDPPETIEGTFLKKAREGHEEESSFITWQQINREYNASQNSHNNLTPSSKELKIQELDGLRKAEGHFSTEIQLLNKKKICENFTVKIQDVLEEIHQALKLVRLNGNDHFNKLEEKLENLVVILLSLCVDVEEKINPELRLTGSNIPEETPSSGNIRGQNQDNLALTFEERKLLLSRVAGRIESDEEKGMVRVGEENACPSNNSHETSARLKSVFNAFDRMKSEKEDIERALVALERKFDTNTTCRNSPDEVSQNEISFFTHQVSTLETANQVHEREIISLRSELDLLKQLEKDIRIEWEDSLKKNKEMASSLQKEKRKFDQNSSDLAREIVSSRNIITEKDTKINKIQINLRHAESEIVFLDQKLIELQRELKSIDRTLDFENSSEDEHFSISEDGNLDSRTSRMLERIGQIHSAVSHFKPKISKLIDISKKCTSSETGCEARIKRLVSDIRLCKEDLESVLREKQKLETDLVDLNNRIEAFKEEVSCLKNDRAAKSAKIKRLKMLVLSLRSDMNTRDDPQESFFSLLNPPQHQDMIIEQSTKNGIVLDRTLKDKATEPLELSSCEQAKFDASMPLSIPAIPLQQGCVDFLDYTVSEMPQCHAAMSRSILALKQSNACYRNQISRFESKLTELLKLLPEIEEEADRCLQMRISSQVGLVGYDMHVRHVETPELVQSDQDYEFDYSNAGKNPPHADTNLRSRDLASSERLVANIALQAKKEIEKRNNLVANLRALLQQQSVEAATLILSLEFASRQRNDAEAIAAKVSLQSKKYTDHICSACKIRLRGV